ncbi:MAG: hypothetical protein JW902_12265 [Syntrophaceae bacterium]|nr:hypothetical protein [Syntrophaceae bacterium]
MKNDLETQREDLLLFIDDRTDASLRHLLALVPKEQRTYAPVLVTTSTEGTGNASEK